jgi:flavin-dependent dehydrogenase
LIGRQAVVVGAGMGGLAAAGALAPHFEAVVVLERDRLPPAPAPRAGTPQARHVHALLLSGQQALDALFPGFERDLAAAGAVPLAVGLDILMERPGSIPSRAAISAGSTTRCRARLSSTWRGGASKASATSRCATAAASWK